jgi:hypothetical protein
VKKAVHKAGVNGVKGLAKDAQNDGAWCFIS